MLHRAADITSRQLLRLSLRSVSSLQLEVPRTCLVTVSDWTCSAAGYRLWTSLLIRDVTDCQSVETVSRHL